MTAKTRLITSAAVAGGAALAVGLSSCRLPLGAETLPEEQREEVFEFELEPGGMAPAEVERRVDEMVPEGRVVPGSGVHRATVTAPSGSVDFYSYRIVDPSLGPGPTMCTATVAGFGMGASCGGEEERVDETVWISGESWGGLWRSAEFLVDVNVDVVEATADDGTVYTITPVDGFGYVEWPDERGQLELVALDAAGEELGRAFTERGS